MWVKPEGMIKKTCPECSSHLLSINESNECDSCNEFQPLFRCSKSIYEKCDFKNEICLKCVSLKLVLPKKKLQPKREKKLYIFGCGLFLAMLLFYFINSSKVEDLANIVERLRQQFPSQKNETWYHILSVLEQKVPAVKSITLLHKNDRKTSYCLAKELVNIFSSNVKIGEVSFNLERIQYRDYGEVLEHYHTVVKRFRVLVINLNKVPATIARVFHSLCDEVSSDIKPSLFIFILQCNDDKVNLKPLEKATSILKEAWSDLPESDIFPLLSRVVKNVVDVIPEKQAIC